MPRAVPSPPRAVTEDPGRRRFCSPNLELSSASRMRNRTRGGPQAWGSLPRSSDLAEALDQRVLLCAQPDGVAVAHGQVDLSAMAPERGGVRGDPVRKQPAEEHVGRRSRPPPAPATQPRPTWARPPARHSHTPTVPTGTVCRSDSHSSHFSLKPGKSTSTPRGPTAVQRCHGDAER